MRRHPFDVLKGLVSNLTRELQRGDDAKARQTARSIVETAHELEIALVSPNGKSAREEFLDENIDDGKRLYSDLK